MSETHPQRVAAKSRAIAQFKNFRSAALSGPVFLNGETAEILHQEESYSVDEGELVGYVLTLFLLTPEGHHFLFMSNEADRPFLKYLAPDRARLVLKDKYKAGGATDA
ncbi:hypothetical protein [Duganella sp. HH101]|uniref:hypothetical protein n=1 Tax=Duganella sp. HH101 TaxID=1781066 RepID=UPI00114D303C|nr:hypothetical protein [Duganella sp. HH101]